MQKPPQLKQRADRKELIMSTPLDSRIQWLHRQIYEKRYPNAYRISEKFDISHRQAQRDIEYLKTKLNAPLNYDATKKGFYYTETFSLPSYLSHANEGDYTEIMAQLKQKGSSGVGESETVQMQIPFSAEISVSDKLGILALKDFIIEAKNKNSFICEFHNVDLFLGMLFTLDANVRIISPEWLRQKALKCAQKIIDSNK